MAEAGIQECTESLIWLLADSCLPGVAQQQSAMWDSQMIQMADLPLPHVSNQGGDTAHTSWVIREAQIKILQRVQQAASSFATEVWESWQWWFLKIGRIWTLKARREWHSRLKEQHIQRHRSQKLQATYEEYWVISATKGIRFCLKGNLIHTKIFKSWFEHTSRQHQTKRG